MEAVWGREVVSKLRMFESDGGRAGYGGDIRRTMS